MGDVVAPVENPAARGVDQLEEAAADGRLPGTALADEAEGLAAADVERHVADGGDDVVAPLDREFLDQPFDADERLGGSHRNASSVGSGADIPAGALPRSTRTQ